VSSISVDASQPAGVIESSRELAGAGGGGGGEEGPTAECQRLGLPGREGGHLAWPRTVG